MPTSDPNELTVLQLKRELQRKKVPLPDNNARKDSYVQLYRKHILKQGALGFSSDEEEESPRPRQYVRKSQTSRRTTSVVTSPAVRKGAYKIIFQDKLSDVEDLTNHKLKSELEKRGVLVGPIVGSTRQVYERKLADLLVEEDVGHSSKSQATMVSFNEEDEEDEDEEDDEEEEEEEEEQQEESDKFSDSDSVEEDKPQLTQVYDRGNSRMIQRRTVTQEVRSGGRTKVYKSSSTSRSSSSSKKEKSNKPWRYYYGLPVFVWWLLILAAVVLFAYLVWSNMESSSQSLSNNKSIGNKE